MVSEMLSREVAESHLPEGRLCWFQRRPETMKNKLGSGSVRYFSEEL